MVQDIHPLTAPKNSLSNALNATIITFNGNEFMIQNDMGNAKVETARLPKGYVPIGMKAHGGIVYVISYNPLTNMSQIGSFPSPERITYYDETENTGGIIFSNQDFNFKSGVGFSQTVSLKDIFQTILNPGDSFGIYIDKDGVSETYLSNIMSFYKNTELKKFITVELLIEESNIPVTGLIKYANNYWATYGNPPSDEQLQIYKQSSAKILIRCTIEGIEDFNISTKFLNESSITRTLEIVGSSTKQTYSNWVVDAFGSSRLIGDQLQSTTNLNSELNLNGAELRNLKITELHEADVINTSNDVLPNTVLRDVVENGQSINLTIPNLHITASFKKNGDNYVTETVNGFIMTAAKPAFYVLATDLNGNTELFSYDDLPLLYDSDGNNYYRWGDSIYDSNHNKVNNLQLSSLSISDANKTKVLNNLKSLEYYFYYDRASVSKDTIKTYSNKFELTEKNLSLYGTLNFGYEVVDTVDNLLRLYHNPTGYVKDGQIHVRAFKNIDLKANNPYIYQVMPVSDCKHYGEFVTNITIDPKKINSQILSLTSYKYLYKDLYQVFNFGFEYYPSQRVKSNNLIIEFYDTANGNSILIDLERFNLNSTISQQISLKDTVSAQDYTGVINGSEYKGITLLCIHGANKYHVFKSFQALNTIGLRKNNLYFIKFHNLEIYKDGNTNLHKTVFGRFMYTSEQFNDYFDTTVDFDELIPDIKIDLETNIHFEKTPESSIETIKCINNDYKDVFIENSYILTNLTKPNLIGNISLNFQHSLGFNYKAYITSKINLIKDLKLGISDTTNDFNVVHKINSTDATQFIFNDIKFTQQINNNLTTASFSWNYVLNSIINYGDIQKNYPLKLNRLMPIFEPSFDRILGSHNRQFIENNKNIVYNINYYNGKWEFEEENNIILHFDGLKIGNVVSTDNQIEKVEVPSNAHQLLTLKDMYGDNVSNAIKNYFDTIKPNENYRPLFVPLFFLPHAGNGVQSWTHINDNTWDDADLWKMSYVHGSTPVAKVYEKINTYTKTLNPFHSIVSNITLNNKDIDVIFMWLVYNESEDYYGFTPNYFPIYNYNTDISDLNKVYVTTTCDDLISPIYEIYSHLYISKPVQYNLDVTYPEVVTYEGNSTKKSLVFNLPIERDVIMSDSDTFRKILLNKEIKPFRTLSSFYRLINKNVISTENNITIPVNNSIYNDITDNKVELSHTFKDIQDDLNADTKLEIPTIIYLKRIGKHYYDDLENPFIPKSNISLNNNIGKNSQIGDILYNQLNLYTEKFKIFSMSGNCGSEQYKKQNNLQITSQTLNQNTIYIDFNNSYFISKASKNFLEKSIGMKLNRNELGSNHIWSYFNHNGAIYENTQENITKLGLRFTTASLQFNSRESSINTIEDFGNQSRIKINTNIDEYFPDVYKTAVQNITADTSSGVVPISQVFSIFPITPQVTGNPRWFASASFLLLATSTTDYIRFSPLSVESDSGSQMYMLRLLNKIFVSPTYYQEKRKGLGEDNNHKLILPYIPLLYYSRFPIVLNTQTSTDYNGICEGRRVHLSKQGDGRVIINKKGSNVPNGYHKSTIVVRSGKNLTDNHPAFDLNLSIFGMPSYVFPKQPGFFTYCYNI